MQTQNQLSTLFLQQLLNYRLRQGSGLTLSLWGWNGSCPLSTLSLASQLRRSNKRKHLWWLYSQNKWIEMEMDWSHLVDWIQEIFITWQWPSDYNCIENKPEWATYSLDPSWILRDTLQTSCAAGSPCNMSYKPLCCLAWAVCLVLPGCFVTESPVSSSGLSREQWEGCLSDHMWYCGLCYGLVGLLVQVNPQSKF